MSKRKAAFDELTRDRFSGHGNTKERKRKAKFKAGQTVCITGLEMPLGCAVIRKHMGDEQWEVDIEIGGKLERDLRTTGDLRPLTRKECGDA